MFSRPPYLYKAQNIRKLKSINSFFDHFNAFRVLKYLNYVHEGLYLKTDISQAVDALFLESGYPLADCDEGRLTFLRNL